MDIIMLEKEVLLCLLQINNMTRWLKALLHLQKASKTYLLLF